MSTTCSAVGHSGVFATAFDGGNAGSPRSEWLDALWRTEFESLAGYGGALPAKAIWFGFTINTIFYATLSWLIVAAPFALRRHLHRRRNLCAHCAYPIGTNDVCTECGNMLASSGAFSPRVAVITGKDPSG